MCAATVARPGTVAPAVRLADEYNTFFASLEEVRARRRTVDEACAQAGRAPLTFSLMTQCIVGEDSASVGRREARIAALTGKDPAERANAKVVGTVEEVVTRLRAYEEAGVERVMLQHLLPDDLEMVELLGREVAPRVA